MKQQPNKPFKQRNIQNCAACRLGICHPGNPLGAFWRMTVDRLMVDQRAVSRQHGLELMLGGHAGIAAAMGPDADIAAPLTAPHEVLICETCLIDRLPVIMEAIFTKENAAEEPDTEPAPIGGAGDGGPAYPIGARAE